MDGEVLAETEESIERPDDVNPSTASMPLAGIVGAVLESRVADRFDDGGFRAEYFMDVLDEDADDEGDILPSGRG